MYAIVDEGGRQLRAEKGARLRLDPRAAEPSGDVVLDRVLLVGGDGPARIGRPTIPGARVRCRIVEEGRARKILVFRYKSKKGIRRKTGHRQPFLDVVVEEIVPGPSNAGT